MNQPDLQSLIRDFECCMKMLEDMAYVYLSQDEAADTQRQIIDWRNSINAIQVELQR